MEVSFGIGFDVGPNADELLYVGPDEMRSEAGTWLPLLGAMEFGYEPGELAIIDNGAETIVRDTLRFLVMDWCFQAIPPLVSGESFLYQYVVGDSSAQLLAQDDDVLISGPHLTPQAYPKRPLLRALHECGQSYLDFLVEVDERYAAGLAPYRQAAEAARAALEGS